MVWFVILYLVSIHSRVCLLEILNCGNLGMGDIAVSALLSLWYVSWQSISHMARHQGQALLLFCLWRYKS